MSRRLQIGNESNVSRRQWVEVGRCISSASGSSILPQYPLQLVLNLELININSGYVPTIYFIHNGLLRINFRSYNYLREGNVHEITKSIISLICALQKFMYSLLFIENLFIKKAILGY